MQLVRSWPAGVEIDLGGARWTELDGVDAILSVSPYYNKPSQEGIFLHFKAIADASPVPVIFIMSPAEQLLTYLLRQLCAWRVILISLASRRRPVILSNA